MYSIIIVCTIVPSDYHLLHYLTIGVAADTVSVHDIIDHNLISFDVWVTHRVCMYLYPFHHLCILYYSGEDDGTDPDDFVFEEFVRLRVAGIEENNETEAWDGHSHQPDHVTMAFIVSSSLWFSSSYISVNLNISEFNYFKYILSVFGIQHY